MFGLSLADEPVAGIGIGMRHAADCFLYPQPVPVVGVSSRRAVLGQRREPPALCPRQSHPAVGKGIPVCVVSDRLTVIRGQQVAPDGTRIGVGVRGEQISGCSFLVFIPFFGKEIPRAVIGIFEFYPVSRCVVVGTGGRQLSFQIIVIIRRIPVAVDPADIPERIIPITERAGMILVAHFKLRNARGGLIPDRHVLIVLPRDRPVIKLPVPAGKTLELIVITVQIPAAGRRKITQSPVYVVDVVLPCLEEIADLIPDAPLPTGAVVGLIGVYHVVAGVGNVVPDQSADAVILQIVPVAGGRLGDRGDIPVPVVEDGILLHPIILDLLHPVKRVVLGGNDRPVRDMICC